MLFIVLFASISVLATTTTAQGNQFEDFRNRNKDTVDHSSLTTCFFLGGKKIDLVQPGNKDKGYKCTVMINGETKNEHQAQQLCESRLPYYVIQSKSDSATKITTCTFQINVECDVGYWQINRKCYKVTQVKYTWAEAQQVCNRADKKELEPKVAEYYSIALSNYLYDIIGIDAAWVYVPYLLDYYANGGDGHAALYVQDGAYKYDTKTGSILMDDESVKHQVLCEYTAPMTKAEMFYIGEVYSEVYPINVYDDGAIIPSGDFMTIHQTELVKTKDKKTGQAKWVEHFTTKNFDDKCMSIGKILNVKSYPMTALEAEFNDVKDYLTRQRFYLTNAYKEDGCLKMHYRQRNENGTSFQIFESDVAGKNEQMCNAHSFAFHKNGRFPTMAAMRAPLLCALHTFNWEFGQCPPGPSWSETPIRYVRKDKRAFCHYISNRRIAQRDEAIQICEAEGLGASLTGFDEPEEFTTIVPHVKPVYPPGSQIYPGTLPVKRFYISKGVTPRVDDHYWLGGRSPCNTDCVNSKGEEYVASWDDGVGVNTHFLNNYNHEGHPWKNENETPMHISFRNDKNAFHVHPLNDPYTYMFFICGKTAPLVRSGRQGTGLAKHG